MTDTEIKSISLFFFFAFLDDRKALQSSSEAYEFLQKKIDKNPDIKKEVAVVTVTQEIWSRHRKKWKRGEPYYSKDSGWLLPEGLEMSPWIEFQKSSLEEDLLAVIWSKVLGINDEDISHSLGLSVGTLRYRVGRGLRQLGALTPLKGKNV